MDPEQTEERMLRQFIRSVLKQKGDTNADEDALFADLSARIDEAIVDALPEEALDKFLAMVEEEGEENMTEEEVERVVLEAGVDREAVLRGVLEKFRDEHLRKEGE